MDAVEEIRWYIASINPVDEVSWMHSWEGCEKLFEFSDDGCGNGYMIDPRIDDPPVFFHDHEEGIFSYVCDNLSEFIAWPIMPGEEQ